MSKTCKICGNMPGMREHCPMHGDDAIRGRGIDRMLKRDKKAQASKQTKQPKPQEEK